MGVMIMMIAGTLPSVARMLGMIGMLHMVMFRVIFVLILYIYIHILGTSARVITIDPILHILRLMSNIIPSILLRIY
jgi:hypothetical protein